MFFRRYAKKVLTSFTANSIIQAKKPVGQAERIGESYNVPITFATEQGVTYKRVGQGAFGLKNAVDGEIKNLLIQGANHVVRARIGYEGAAASLAGKEAAADNTLGRVAESLRTVARKRIECDFLYGQTGLGIVESITDATHVVVSEAEWAPNIWVGGKNAIVQFHTPGYAAGSEQIETTLVGMVSGTRTLTVVSTAGIDVGNIITFQDQVEEGASPAFNTCLGLHAQLGDNTVSHFGQSKTANEVISANVISANNARLSFDVVQEGVSRCQDMGADSMDYVLLCSPLTWVRLNSDLAADRRFDGSYTKSKGELGVETIKYHSSMGTIEIMAHPLVKRGYAYGFSWDDIIRPGSYDLSFTRPGGSAEGLDVSGSIFTEVTDVAGYEVRLYHNSAIAHLVPSHGFMVNLINNA